MESLNVSISSIWTSESLTDESLRSIEERLKSLPQVSHVNHSVLPARDEAIRMNTICGLPQSSAYAWYDPDTSSWKTFQGCLLTNTCDEYTATWPKAGIVLNGVAYLRRKWERIINEIDYGGLLPTPTANMIDMWASAEKLLHTRFRPSGVRIGSNLSWMIAKWHLQNGYERDNNLIPDPCFYETMMEFPIGWTDLKPLGMHKFQQWLERFGDC